MSKSSLEAAAEAAAKVNAMLIAKGKLKLSPSQLKPKIGGGSLGRGKGLGDLITAEVDINDAPLSARNLLTRGHTQDEICKMSGAAISTRGRYMTPEERQNISTPECRPLYLNVQASTHDAVQHAVRKIQEIIDQHVVASGGIKNPTVGVVTYPSSSSNGVANISIGSMSANHFTPGLHFVQDKVFIGLEQTPADYPVRDKILGPGGSFLQHIRTETGATVTLRGKGSGFIEPTSGREAFEPLYIHITHPKAEGLQAAKALAINLVETAHVEFAQWQQTQQPSVLHPLTSVVLPQAPVAYQNQVVVTPAVLPVSIGSVPTASSFVGERIQIPTASVAGGTLTPNIPNLVQAAPVSMSSLITPVTVVSSLPLSVQGIPSQTVITYPTYVASHSPVVARPPTPVITARPAPTPVSIIGMMPPLPVSAAYTVANSQPGALTAAAFRPPAPLPVVSQQPDVFSQPLAYTTVVPSPTQINLSQSAVPPSSLVVAPADSSSYPPAPYVPAAVAPASCPWPPPPHPQVAEATEPKKRKLHNRNILIPIPQPSSSLQESNSNHPTELAGQRRRGTHTGSSRSGSSQGPYDKELMPPPPPLAASSSNSVFSPAARHQGKGSSVKTTEVANEPQPKRSKGALSGIAAYYGSDDSDEDSSASS